MIGAETSTEILPTLTDARVQYEQGCLDAALAACRSHLTRAPRDIDALHLLGLIRLRQGRSAEAVALLAEVAEHTDNAALLNDLAGACKAAGLTAEALDHLMALTRSAPDYMPGFYNLGTLLLDLDRDREALAALREAVRLAPDFPDAAHAMARALLRAGNAAYVDFDASNAEALYREALSYDPLLVAALGNLGNALTLQLRMDEALASYAHALQLEPDHPEIGFAYALALLLNGDLTPGWRHYEARLRVGPMRWNYDRRHDLPHWEPGIPLTGKRVLLMSEQGMGDIVHYARYFELLSASGVSVVPELPNSLRPLFAMPTIGLDDPTPADCDLAMPLLSAPLVLGTTLETIPARIPYIHIPEDRLTRWRSWVGERASGQRIGVVCCGDARHPHDRLRSIPLVRLAPLLSMPDREFVLVQNDLRDGDKDVRQSMPHLRYPGTALEDFADTAALMAQCDLIITVDTSSAHIAGALGLPVWLMLPYSPDYRWLLGRSDSPWYPTMRLYRQPSLGDWDAVIETVMRDLSRA